MEKSVEDQIAEFLKYCEENNIELSEHYPLQIAHQIKLWKYYHNNAGLAQG